MKQGLVNTVELHSDYLNRTVKLGIYLPENYTSLYKHHVLIAFDGQDFSQLGQLHRSYEKLAPQGIERAIIVYVHYPDVETRKKEYHPDGEDKQAMIQFVTRELLPYIDQQFSTLKTGNARILMGDSLAASLSLSIALAYPQTFSQCVLFSPMINVTIDHELKRCSNLSLLNLYHVIGKEENSFRLMTGEQADFLTPNREFHQQLLNYGVTTTYIEADGDHTWKTWKPQLDSVIQYFLA